MKTNSKILFSVVFALLLAAMFAVAAFAATPGTGYCVNSAGKATNIKWTMTEDGTLTFEIDAAATDKVATTELFAKDPVTGDGCGWDKALPTFADAVKIVIGDGITNLAGFPAMRKLKQIEVPTSCVKLSGAAIESDGVLSSIYVRGTEPVAGTFDLSYFTSFAAYSMDGCFGCKKVILNPNLTGVIETEVFKSMSITELEIPAGVTVIKDKALANTKSLLTLTILGNETTLQSDTVFAQNTTFPKIKAPAGSKAEEFAKANGYTYINLETGEETQGTKPCTKAATGGSSGGTSGNTGGQSGTGTPTTKPVENFVAPANATLWGHSSGKYNGGDIINTWWVYYDDTKTLEFISATSEYNETGGVGNVDKEYTNWSEYKDVIEHIIVGDYIVKVSGSAFMNYPALKDVKLGVTVSQIDANAFKDCPNLTTIWRSNGERIEGRFDFTGIPKINSIIAGTSIKEVVFPAGVTSISIDLPPSIKTIYVDEITAELDQYAKDNLFNLQNINNPDDKREYWVFVDPTLPSCGGRSVFGFDEATGTLTIYGAGTIDDIVNYHGGGSKNSPWFDIKQQIKHVIISDNITVLGKYAFAECENLETVQIPNREKFEILNAAFEGCSSLKSIYRSGSEPIEGTLDLRNVPELNSWTFAYDFLIANVIVSPEVKKIGTSVFEENIDVNLANIYGVPGSYAEKYATDNGKTFYDVASNTPAPITCTPPPETSETIETETLAPETNEVSETSAAPESSDAPETTAAPVIDFVEDGGDSEGGSILPVIIIAAVAVVAVAAVVAVVVMKKKKASK